MFDMRLMNPLETVPLNQFDDPAKSRLHVVRENVKLLSNSVIEHFHDPRHYSNHIAFLQ